VLHAYEVTKQHQNVIDFEDMIIMATSFVEEKQFDSRYKCILVDEFQDISVARARLVKALHQSDSKNLLTVVGDDWQSIYRFAGSDISLFHKFGEYFGDYESVTLDYTFRFNDKISLVSQQFIEQNPNQIKKSISTIKRAKDEKVHVWIGDNKNLLQIESLLESFTQDNEGQSFSVYILGRTRFAFPLGINTIKSKFPMAKITTSTAHSSKGLEADYVIITGVESGPFGFPSTLADDPLLDIVLAKQEGFEFAEERRLFYVALTRAKKEVHILSSDRSISPFIKELEKVHLVKFHYIDDVKVQTCPECNTGTLVLRNSKYGGFYGCTNFAKFGCSYKQKM
jgi:DNA helicase-4